MLVGKIRVREPRKRTGDKPRQRRPARRGRTETRVVPVLHAKKRIVPDPRHERELATHLRRSHSARELLALLDRFIDGSSDFDALMRRVLWRALTRRFGDAVTIGRGIRCHHMETFEIGDGVFIGDGAYIQGRHDGRFRLGRRVWIGPGSYFDARDVVLDDEVGWGAGAAALSSEHTTWPPDVPVIATDVDVRSIRVRRGGAVGARAVLLPGVSVGQNTFVGAGAVVMRSVPAGVIVVGAPARVIRQRAQRTVPVR
jgi:acetyltransferase-like isoleucine patch superfamily enzyme